MEERRRRRAVYHSLIRRESRREGDQIANAIGIILEREQKAEEQRRLRRLQVYKHVLLLAAVFVLFGIHAGNYMMNTFANTFPFPPYYGGNSLEAGQKTELESEEKAGLEKAILTDEDGRGRVSAPKPCYASIQVENGDSLWSIASRYAHKSPMDIQGYVDELKRINQLNGDTIHAGHYLMIVYYQ